jgi:hypothetical protein
MVLSGLCELLREADERGESVSCHDTVNETPRFGNSSLATLLTTLPERDLRVELLRRIGKLTSFGDGDLVAFEVVTPDGVVHLAPSVAWAHQEGHRGRNCGCLTPSSSQRLGAIAIAAATNGESKTIDVFFIGDGASHVGFFRWTAVREGADERRFAELVPFAYPDLHFLEGALRGLRALSRPFVDCRDLVMQSLAVLNDHGAGIFTLGQQLKIVDGFRAHGVVISPENAETLRDAKCKKERERQLGAILLVLQWHIKLRKDRDRIHVHPPVMASRGRVVVGIIHEHLRLPGD